VISPTSSSKWPSSLKATQLRPASTIATIRAKRFSKSWPLLTPAMMARCLDSRGRTVGRGMEWKLSTAARCPLARRRPPRCYRAGGSPTSTTRRYLSPPIPYAGGSIRLIWREVRQKTDKPPTLARTSVDRGLRLDSAAIARHAAVEKHPILDDRRGLIRGPRKASSW